MRTLALACTLFVHGVAADAASLPMFDATDLTPYWQSSDHIPATVQAFVGIDQSGSVVRETSLDGNLSLVNFFFTECGSVCPPMMAILQHARNKLHELGVPITLYSFSITPEHDTPQVLEAYALGRGLELSNWHLVTGEREEIYRVGKAMLKADRAVPSRDGGSAFIHSQDVYLLDTQRRIRGIYTTSNSEDMAHLVQDTLHLAHR